MNINKLKNLLIAAFFVIMPLRSSILCMEGQEVYPSSKEGKVNTIQAELSDRIPTGGIIPFAGEHAPDGWLMCDGNRYSSLNYPALYEVIKTKYVPVNEQWIIKANEHSAIEKFFHVPDLKYRGKN